MAAGRVDTCVCVLAFARNTPRATPFAAAAAAFLYALHLQKPAHTALAPKPTNPSNINKPPETIEPKNNEMAVKTSTDPGYSSTVDSKKPTRPVIIHNGGGQTPAESGTRSNGEYHK
ncbi:hypothetical protein M8818_007230 [Zalaria obscura]|uniref:Uncharacterized protein n=1 Tax=Zalaria obscura TaxID=2024903 RepID=A0ACC3S4T8_9PEZI